MERTVQVKNVTKSYKNNTKVLDGVNYDFEKGKFYAIMGRSGAGKSTLLNIIGTIDDATEGDVCIEGENISGLKEKEKAQLRMKKIGFIFQGFYLNPYLNALENVITPMRINPEIPAKERRNLALNLLDSFGVKELEKSLPSQMSGGEQQRVCIARALANNPDIILADEPTGNLDEANEKIVFSYLKKLAEEGHTVIAVSHNEAVKDYADEIVEIVKCGNNR
jgi:ABC-type lipoprotein export system ATPase subunit